MKDAVLVLGAGNSKLQRIALSTPGLPPAGPAFSDNFKDVWTIDIDHHAAPKVEWDLERFPWPVPEEYFDEVHAYEVLEHLGTMGDYASFFELWKAIWKALKPEGLVFATTPWWESVWAWQDPGHRRVYSRELLTYLNQKDYAKQIGVTSMTDYRRIYPPPFSFNLRTDRMTGEDPRTAGYMFVLQKEQG